MHCSQCRLRSAQLAVLVVPSPVESRDGPASTNSTNLQRRVARVMRQTGLTLLSLQTMIFRILKLLFSRNSDHANSRSVLTFGCQDARKEPRYRASLFAGTGDEMR